MTGFQPIIPRQIVSPSSISRSALLRTRAPPQMAAEIMMPALSSTMTEGKISQWLKSEGDKVEVGDMVLVVESDKADMDVEAYEEGYIAKILVPEGESALVGAPVAILVETEAEIAGAAAAGVVPTAAAASDGTVSADAVDVEMAQIMMPALSSTMTEGKISSWLVDIGDKVEVGDMLLVVESDKADMDVESYEEGYLAAILTPEGESALVGAPVGLLATNKEDIDKVAAAGANAGPNVGAAAAASATTVAPTVATTPSGGTAAVPAASGDRIVASPFAKTLAAEKGIDLSFVVGTGPDGRIVAEDVEKAVAGGAAASPAPPPYVSKNLVATPEAKKLAKAKKLDLSSIKGTGNFGRITADDVRIAAGDAPKLPLNVLPTLAPPATAATSTAGPTPAPTPAPTPVPTGAVPMNAMQKAVVKNMEWANSVPTYQARRASTTPARPTVAPVIIHAITVATVTRSHGPLPPMRSMISTNN